MHLTLSCIMLKNDQTYFKNLKIFKVCLVIFQHFNNFMKFSIKHLPFRTFYLLFDRHHWWLHSFAWAAPPFLTIRLLNRTKMKLQTFLFNFINLLKLEKQSKSYTQSAFTCSKLTIKTLDHGVKYVQVTKIYWNEVFLMFLSFSKTPEKQHLITATHKD